ncbi:MAG: serine O-acetyltransferase [Clostridia bacterium]|nr:serine O-acetyltransferase [Clostridia bacterium]
MFDQIREDIAAVKERDPAAKSSFEIFFLYPGVKAIRMYRRAHKHFIKGHFFRARLISQRAARKTGIEIHPGAKIGRRLVIDHGTGIVIGETAEIGDDCLLYQGVTLGGTGKDVGKRHPTLGNNVMVSAGAKVLGPFKIGDNSRVAAGAVVLHEVPPNSTVVGVPAHVVRQNGKKIDNNPLDQIHIPDPIQQEIDKLEERIKLLEKAKGE